MGGKGSGGGRGAPKVPSFFEIDLADLNRAGLGRRFTAARLASFGAQGGISGVLIVREPDRLRVQDLDPDGLAASGWRSIALRFSRQRLGGRRAWMACSGCGGRRRVLYRNHDGAFACRRCLGATYASQYEPPLFGAIDRARALRARLGGSADFYAPFPDRPKHMRRATYARISALAEANEDRIHEALDRLAASL